MRFVTRHFSFATILSVCVLIETIAYTYAQQEGSTFYYSSSLVYCLAGLFICVLPLFYKNQTQLSKNSGLYKGKYLSIAFTLFLLGLLIYHVRILAPTFESTEINVVWA